MTPSPEPAPGAVVAGRFCLEAPLGAGGMGSVWRARHLVTGRRQALKFLNVALAADEAARARFAREARLASAVDHPNVVRVHDLFEVDGCLVMVMDYLEGRTLANRLAEARQLPLEEIASYLVPTVSAVGAAHAHGVVHRDLKPENVFLAGAPAAPVVKVLDFGIAKAAVAGAGASRRGLTATGILLGTPCYMSPEQGGGERDIDHRTDVWALGVILYEALAGARPIEGESLGEVVRHLLEGGITPIEAIVPELPSDVAFLVGRMLAHDREDRPGDLREVLQVLERYTAVRAPPFGHPSTAGAEEVALPEARAPIATPRAEAARGAATAVDVPRAWAAAVVLAVGAGAVWFVVGRRGGGDSENVATASAHPPRAERAATSTPPVLPPSAPKEASAAVEPVAPAPPAASSKRRLGPTPPMRPPPPVAAPTTSVASPRRAAQDGLVDEPPF